MDKEKDHVQRRSTTLDSNPGEASDSSKSLHSSKSGTVYINGDSTSSANTRVSPDACRRDAATQTTESPICWRELIPSPEAPRGSSVRRHSFLQEGSSLINSEGPISDGPPPSYNVESGSEKVSTHWTQNNAMDPPQLVLDSSTTLNRRRASSLPPCPCIGSLTPKAWCIDCKQFVSIR